jgi:hypothetical protein
VVREGSNVESEKRLLLVRFFCIPPTRKDGAILTSLLSFRLIGFVDPRLFRDVAVSTRFHAWTFA